MCVCAHERKSTYRSVVLSILYRCVKQEKKQQKFKKIIKIQENLVDYNQVSH